MTEPAVNIDGDIVAPPPSRPKRTPVLCAYCNVNKPQILRPKTGCKVCKTCFIRRFEDEIHHTIITNGMFTPGEKVAIGASGGKDSTVLAHVMTTLNERYNYGLDLFLLSIDEGISGYRDDSLETVKRNQEQYKIPLKILSYKDLYGWTMDEIVRKIGNKNNCTFCGVFRRQALDRGAQLMKADKLLTGHNCDDLAETVLLNLLRGDVPRLGRCVDIITGRNSSLPRAKPFKYTYEKEIVMYAYFLDLDYFSTECKYAPFAYRGYAREFMKDLERADSTALVKIVMAAEHFLIPSQHKIAPSTCVKCGYISSQSVCKACVLLYALETDNVPAAITGKIVIHKDGTLAPPQVKKNTHTITQSNTNTTDADTTGTCGSSACCNSNSNTQQPCCGSSGSTCSSSNSTTVVVNDKVYRAMKKQEGKEQVIEYAEDYPEILEQLTQLGLRIKEKESLGSAKRRIKKTIIFNEKKAQTAAAAAAAAAGQTTQTTST